MAENFLYSVQLKTLKSNVYAYYASDELQPETFRNWTILTLALRTYTNIIDQLLVSDST